MNKLIGWLQQSRVIIEGKESELQSLRDKGFFGKINNGVLELSLYEGLYLLEKGKIIIYHLIKKQLSINGYVRKVKRFEERFLIRYTAYKDLRNKGYVVKAALKYGADFAVYDKGARPGVHHSKWLLFAVNSGETLDWQRFSAMIRVAHSVRKELMIGIIDSQGDVTYYIINWIKP